MQALVSGAAHRVQASVRCSVDRSGSVQVAVMMTSRFSAALVSLRVPSVLWSGM